MRVGILMQARAGGGPALHACGVHTLASSPSRSLALEPLPTSAPADEQCGAGPLTLIPAPVALCAPLKPTLHHGMGMHSVDSLQKSHTQTQQLPRRAVEHGAVRAVVVHAHRREASVPLEAAVAPGDALVDCARARGNGACRRIALGHDL